MIRRSKKAPVVPHHVSQLSASSILLQKYSRPRNKPRNAGKGSVLQGTTSKPLYLDRWSLVDVETPPMPANCPLKKKYIVGVTYGIGSKSAAVCPRFSIFISLFAGSMKIPLYIRFCRNIALHLPMRIHRRKRVWILMCCQNARYAFQKLAPRLSLPCEEVIQERILLYYCLFSPRTKYYLRAYYSFLIIKVRTLCER